MVITGLTRNQLGFAPASSNLAVSARIDKNRIAVRFFCFAHETHPKKSNIKIE